MTEPALNDMKSLFVRIYPTSGDASVFLQVGNNDIAQALLPVAESLTPPGWKLKRHYVSMVEKMGVRQGRRRAVVVRLSRTGSHQATVQGLKRSYAKLWSVAQELTAVSTMPIRPSSSAKRGSADGAPTR